MDELYAGNAIAADELLQFLLLREERAAGAQQD
jgi:hypothetical protein